MSLTPSELHGIKLEVNRLNRSYKGVPVLRDINFSIKPGEIFVLMGPSGSGKSVLLRHLVGLERPDSGDIRIDDQSIQNPKIRDRYRLTMVFQSSALLNSLTVAQNVGLYLKEHRIKPPEEIDAIVRQGLELVGLRNIEDRFPSELSGGMKKRVAIARALVMEPHMILYDEPTSELDPLMATLVSDEIIKLNRRTGVTTIVVTHERELAFRLAHRIGIIRGGELLCIGNLEEIYNDSTPFVKEFLIAGRNPQNSPTDITLQEHD